MNRLFPIILVLLFACDSAESPTLYESRLIQESILLRVAQADSSLNGQLTSLREQTFLMSSDTLLASDSLLRQQYSAIKEAVNQIEFKQTELRNWRDQLTLLPTKEEIGRGIANPFGPQAGDNGILQALNAYSDSLSELESSISELIRNTTYERTTKAQSQE